MSRIGRQPITLPAGVNVNITDDNITVTGPKGTLSRQVLKPITVTLEDGRLVVARADDEARSRALHGLTRSLIANMVTGVSAGFTRTLQITGVGYRAQVMGKNLVLVVGLTHPVEVAPPPGIAFSIEQVPGQRGGESRVNVTGIDKEAVGAIASQIRAVRKPEPYLGKGIRYSDETILRKAGKTGKAGGKKK